MSACDELREIFRQAYHSPHCAHRDEETMGIEPRWWDCDGRARTAMAVVVVNPDYVQRALDELLMTDNRNGENR